jgi:GH35 family endo-1,4-beta-xylanase
MLQSKDQDGVGMVGHWGLNIPKYIEDAIDAYACGVKVMITELDVDVALTKKVRSSDRVDKQFQLEELRPGSFIQSKPCWRIVMQNGRFYQKRDKIERVTLWGCMMA